jgi:VanZ family protein
MATSLKTLCWVVAEFILIFILLSLPGGDFSDPNSWISMIMALPFADKIVHMALFGSLALSLFFHFEMSEKPSFKTTRTKALALIVCILYGIGMEYYQKYYVPSRGFEVLDMLADALGALCALPVFEFFKKMYTQSFIK